MLTHSASGIGVACHDKRAVDGVRPQEPVNDLQGTEHSACSVANVKRERAMGVCMWILGVRPDVLLNHRRKGRLCDVAIPIDARIDQQVDVMGVASSAVETIFGRPDREVKSATTIAPSAPCVSDPINHCAHTAPPIRYPPSIARCRSRARMPVLSTPPFHRAGYVRP